MDSESPIRYSLTRRQRLIPHLRIWGPAFVPFYVLLETFFVVRFIVAVLTLEWLAVLTFGVLAVGMLILFRGLVTGLVDAVVNARREMNITIEDNALGILIGSERWYLFLDGITKISQYTSDVWTIEHWNGSVVHLLKDMISDEQLNHMQKRMEFGCTAEGTAATIERGRQIEAIYEQEYGINRVRTVIADRPPHTTGHAGPHPAVRRVASEDVSVRNLAALAPASSPRSVALPQLPSSRALSIGAVIWYPDPLETPNLTQGTGTPQTHAHAGRTKTLNPTGNRPAS